MNETLSRNDAELAIRTLIRGTINRAIVESVGCVIVLAAFTAILLGAEPGSLNFFGCVFILVGAGFIGGIVWSFALGYKLLERHPVSDRQFWLAAFQTQARLLRLVPLWYCAPIFTGLLMCVLSNPVEPGMTGVLVAEILLVSGVFAWIVWLNHKAASQLDIVANRLGA